ncbi:MAG: hypothetical protein L0H53_07035 [Candidatus Nitrosocosmicus sp.]|nr:hypothetical protein [Candidatus Nitrosocosmicus sp.]MDN5867711.1 hypothetical protein [Candidatus Nitrosocosmicus sp.]
MAKSRHKSVRWLMMVGFILMIMGIIFQLQSISLLGPSSSFMYANQDWTFNGLIIIGLGASFLVIGLYLKTRKDKNPSNS